MQMAFHISLSIILTNFLMNMLQVLFLVMLSCFIWVLQVFYPKTVADLLHCVPMAIFILLPVILNLSNAASHSQFAIFLDLMKGKWVISTGHFFTLFFLHMFLCGNIYFSIQTLLLCRNDFPCCWDNIGSSFSCLFLDTETNIL